MIAGLDTLSLLWRLTHDYFRRQHRLPLQSRLTMLPIADAPVSRPVSIFWDDHQVPFIVAETDDDLACALGVVHAHLRLGQMELMRRIAQGRLSELVGRRALATDQLIRTFDIARAVPQIMAALPDVTRVWLEGFARGINHVVHRTALPREMQLLGMGKQPWTAADIVTLGRLISADVNWLVWLRIFRLRQRSDWPVLWRQFCTADTLSIDAFAGNTGAFLGSTARIGSNSFVVAGSRTASGGALTASDPHLSITLPNSWLLAGIKSPSHHAVGMMIPGIPFFGIGRNPWIAWGGTSLHAASTDLVSVPDGTPISTREERIQVLHAAEVNLRVRESPWGPIVSDLPAFYAATEIVALRWMGHQPSDEFTAMLRVGQSRNWLEFRNALEGYSVPGLEMIFAAASGEIGRLTAVKLPIRTEPVPADILRPPDNGWEQLKGSGLLPFDLNPVAGFVASANARQMTAAPVIGYHFSPPTRLQRLEKLLGGREPLLQQDIIDAQTDVHRADALTERNAFCAWLGELPQTEIIGELRNLLQNWDGNYDAESRAALVLETLFVCLARDLVPVELRQAWESSWGTRILIWRALLDAPPAGRRNALSRAAMMAARNIKASDWGQRHRLVLTHPLGMVPFFGRRYRLFDLPVSGTSESLMKTAHGLTVKRHRATYGSVARHVSDLADPDANYFALLGGQDGWIGSSTFADQVARWQRREYIRIPLQLETVRHMFPHQTVLQPRASA